MTTGNSFDFLFQWHLTERCNLQCKHCYQSGQHVDELSLSECRDLLDELTEMFTAWQTANGMTFSPSFNISGGEPLLREDLFDILAEISRRGFDFYLLSNGTMINREVAQELAHLGIGGVQISLEGPRHVHDDIRGEGAYDEAISGILRLLSEEITVIANVTLSRLNAPHMEQMIAEMKKLGVPRLGFSRFVPMGKGSDMLTYMLTPVEIEVLYRKLMERQEQGLELVTGDPLAMQLKRTKTDNINAACGGCSAGVSGITLLADGTVVPCRRLPISVGNIRTDSLREIWVTSQILNELRDRESYSGKCGNCSRWGVCRGCRAIAYAYSCFHGTPDYLADDPSCFL